MIVLGQKDNTEKKPVRTKLIEIDVSRCEIKERNEFKVKFDY